MKTQNEPVTCPRLSSLTVYLGALLLASACATPKKQIVTMGMVSMTEHISAKTDNLKEAGPVEVQYCGGDKSVSSNDNEIGLLDELILRGQQASESRYIKNAQFFQQGACFSMEGIAMK